MDVEGFGALIRRAQEGDSRSLEELLVSMRPYLAKVAGGFADSSRASGSASDLIQEAELRAWRGLGRFRGGSGDVETQAKFRTWLVQIVRRISLDRGRARNTAKRRARGRRIQSLDEPGSGSTRGSGASRLEPLAAGPSPSAALEETERSALVRRALEAVGDPTDREVIRLYFFEQLSLPAIAGRLDMTYDRARESCRRGIRCLERRLRDLEPG